MTSARQQVLVLHLNDGDLGSTTVAWAFYDGTRSEEHTSELQSLVNLVCRLLLEKKNNITHLLTL